MFYRSTIFILTLILNAFVAIPADSDKNHIGVTFNQIINHRAVGLIGGFNHNSELLDFAIDGRLQMGDIYRGHAYAEIVLAPTFFEMGIGGKLFTDITAKGSTLDVMGRDQMVGAAVAVLLGGLNFDFGIGGKLSHPWGQPKALNDLLPFKDGNSLNAYIATRWRGDVYFHIKALLELRGEGEKAHQVHSRLQMSRKVFSPWDAIIGAEVGLMFYEREIYTETAAFTGLGFSF